MDITSQPGLLKAIGIAGLIAGTMDITAACTQFYLKTGKGPVLILQYISSAAFGRETAYSGSVLMIVLGLFFHYVIAFGWTTLFFLAYPKIGMLRENKIVMGLVYGIFVWTMMNMVVVKLTRIPSAPFNLQNATIQCAILMICIGLPISLVANRYYHSLRG